MQSENYAVPSHLSELEVQGIAMPEMYAGWKVRREDEVGGLNEALFLLNESETLVDVNSSKKFQHRHLPAMAYHRIPATPETCEYCENPCSNRCQ